VDIAEISTLSQKGGFLRIKRGRAQTPRIPHLASGMLGELRYLRQAND
jgi:hypothetical protein